MNIILKVIIINLLFLLSSLILANKQDQQKEVIKLSPRLKPIINIKEDNTNNQLLKWENDLLDINLLTNKQIKKLPRVIAPRTNNLISMSNDEIYISNIKNINYQQDLAIYRIGAPLDRTKDDDEVLRPLYYIADIKLKKINIENNLSLVKVLSAKKEVLPGDRVYQKSNFNINNITKNNNKKISGKIISVINGVKNAMAGQSVILNLGYKDKLASGNLLKIVKIKSTKRTIRLNEKDSFDKDDINNEKQVKLPGEVIGKLFVYKVFANNSLALVIENDKPISVNDKVKI